jgi:hypothetical protein
MVLHLVCLLLNQCERWISNGAKKICICAHAFCTFAYDNKLLSAAFTEALISTWTFSIKLSNVDILTYLMDDMQLKFSYHVIIRSYNTILLQQFIYLTALSLVASKGSGNEWKVQ